MSDFESDLEDMFPALEAEKQTNKAFIFPTYQLENVDASLFLDRMSLVFGGSGSGKTTIVQYIINTLKQSIPNFIVVTPETSRKFYADFLPASNIWPTLTEQDINNIVDRQEDATKIKSVTNKLPVLHLIHLLVSPKEANGYLINLRNRDFTDEQCISLLRTRLGEGKPDFQKKIKEVLMNTMIRMEAAEDETKVTGLNFTKYGPEDFNIYACMNILERSFKKNPQLEILKRIYNAYCYLDMNPRFCVIIDDMTPQLKAITNYKVLPKNPFAPGAPKGKAAPASQQPNIFLEIATRCRHVGLSVIIITHVFNKIEKEVRINFRTCLFTTQKAFEEAMVEINPDCYTANRQQKIAETVYGAEDEDGNKFTKILHDYDESGTIGVRKLHLKTMKSNGGRIEFIDTTKKIDQYVSRHGSSGESADFNF